VEEIYSNDTRDEELQFCGETTETRIVLFRVELVKEIQQACSE